MTMLNEALSPRGPTGCQMAICAKRNLQFAKRDLFSGEFASYSRDQLSYPCKFVSFSICSRPSPLVGGVQAAWLGEKSSLVFDEAATYRAWVDRDRFEQVASNL